MSIDGILSPVNKKNTLKEEHSIDEANVIYKDMKHFCLVRMENSKNISQVENETNDESNINKSCRKDAKGEIIIKRDEKNKKLKHHVYFIDDVNKDKNLVNITKIKSYKEYNKKCVFNSIYEENFRMQMVEHNCCCIIV